jgi:hypothetical protein
MLFTRAAVHARSFLGMYDPDNSAQRRLMREADLVVLLRELKTHGFWAHPPARVGPEIGGLRFHNPLFSLRPLRLCG